MPYRVAANVTGPIGKSGLAALNGMVTRQAATVAVIDQFEILMFAMLVVIPLVFFLRKPRPAG
jgi:DHA2 family multidrug resistance protein